MIYKRSKVRANVAPTLLVFATGLFLSSCASTLSGQLLTSAGQPITSDAARINIAPLVAAADQTQGQAIILSVDSKGRFATDAKLAEGDYLVEALVPGYAITASRVHLGAKDVKELQLKLSPLGQTRAKATSANLDAEAARGSGGAALTPPQF